MSAGWWIRARWWIRVRRWIRARSVLPRHSRRQAMPPHTARSRPARVRKMRTKCGVSPCRHARSRGWGREVARLAASIVRGEDAEFVALRVGKHHPGLLALADVDVAGVQPDHAVNLRLLIVGPEVEVDAVLDDFVV